jgi:hypothetical protein
MVAGRSGIPFDPVDRGKPAIQGSDHRLAWVAGRAFPLWLEGRVPRRFGRFDAVDPDCPAEQTVEGMRVRLTPEEIFPFTRR